MTQVRLAPGKVTSNLKERRGKTGKIKQAKKEGADEAKEGGTCLDDGVRDPRDANVLHPVIWGSRTKITSNVNVRSGIVVEETK